MALRLTADEERTKANGIHYTPRRLAAYLADQVVNGLKGARAKDGELSILDPACGEGELLQAVVDAVPSVWRCKLRLVGFDMDEAALERARQLLASSGVASVDFHADDFLSCVTGVGASAQMEFLQSDPQAEGIQLEGQFDAVISNPPYVRTQVLGSAAARDLAARFNLTGRVDLYHAFVKAMTLALRKGGILGLLTSNRFLTVQSGRSMRDWLTSQFRLRRLVDLGDTKFFAAAVLPAIVVAERTVSASTQDCEFIRVYEASGTGVRSSRQTRSILDALDGSMGTPERTGRVSASKPADCKRDWTAERLGR